MNYPFVSIIIPAFNAQGFLTVCLDSIMNLDYPRGKYEVLLINNNSTDATETIAKKYPVKVINETEVQSAYAARNAGIKCAKGEVLAFTDTDCVVTPQWLINLLSAADNPQVGCFAGNILSYKPETLAEKFAELDEENHNQHWELTTGYLPSANTANVAYRRNVFNKIGLFNIKLPWSGDAEFTWRFVKQTDYDINYSPDAIVYHKHRSTLRGLYLQYEKYGEGITQLQKNYPGHCVPTVWFVQDIFRFSFRGLVSLPRNVYLYHQKKIPKIDMWFYFIKAMNRIGLVNGRIRAHGILENGKFSVLLVFRYIISRMFRGITLFSP
jgi:glycosyltransferase involved in cell wall biosynthesis